VLDGAGVNRPLDEIRAVVCAGPMRVD